MNGAQNMDSSFRALIDALEPKLRVLVDMDPSMYGKLPRPLPQRAIYLFSEQDRHLYVGRTNRLRERLSDHCTPSATHLKATFAFRIAREQADFLKAAYSKEGSRAALVGHELFGPSFKAAKHRVAKMSIRFVEEADPVRQALLEIYAATALKIPYNDFDNHRFEIAFASGRRSIHNVEGANESWQHQSKSPRSTGSIQ